MHILYEDNHLLVVHKPAGQLVQGDQTGRISLLEEAKTWIKRTHRKPGNVFLGLVHRLDRTTSGVLVLARTSKAAARLSEEFRQHRPEKIYWALVEGETANHDTWVDRLERKPYSTVVVNAPAGKEARLNFRRLNYMQGVSLVEIHLETGRYHQIRAQFGHRGMPIIGDRRYGSKKPFAFDSIALHAHSLKFRHPTLREEMSFSAPPGKDWLPYHSWTTKFQRSS